jgi:hypothetical protein
MKFFGIGPIPLFTRRRPNEGPLPPKLKEFDVYYTSDPVLGVDVMTACDIDSQCAFYVEQFVCSFGTVGFTACDEKPAEEVMGFHALNIIPEGPQTVGLEIL